MRAGADDDGLRELIAGTWSNRRDRYSEERGEATLERRGKIEMSHIGG